MIPKKFRVGVREVYEQGYEVEAETAEEARVLVAEGGGILIEGDFFYVETAECDEWPSAEEITK